MTGFATKGKGQYWGEAGMRPDRGEISKGWEDGAGVGVGRFCFTLVLRCGENYPDSDQRHCFDGNLFAMSHLNTGGTPTSLQELPRREGPRILLPGVAANPYEADDEVDRDVQLENPAS
ncbi:hypothetical protein GGE67_000365 [Rhizobium leucaenae]|uniref:Uncharacterized protein n=1 Tax=Rhizobium leucaenae TaxID=29450 RepID=A0A7W7EL86_9HYPH|nr:hypothetical protein [Rhizobium leucaenae]MBB6299772.1 hypothetical protein [Rhizobium leucaenae]